MTASSSTTIAATAAPITTNDNGTSKKLEVTKKRKRTKKNKPKPGDKGYKTPTQLRNARKRRAKKQKRNSSSLSLPPSLPSQHQNKSYNDESNKKNKKTNNNNKNNNVDPSTQYIHNPLDAPIIRSAKKYFESLKMKKEEKQQDAENNSSGGSVYNNGVLKFPIHIGSKYGWRTVAKLAVRKSSSIEDNKSKNGNKIRIGLFQPNTHTILNSSSNSKVHHPSINESIEVLEAICNRILIKPYDESTGEGHLRHIVLSVERKTQKVQLTIVWNGTNPYNNDYSDTNEEGITPKHNNNNNNKELLESFINIILKSGDHQKRRRRGKRGKAVGEEEKNSSVSPTPTTQIKQLKLHSLWIHFNNAWKHSNAIFSFDDENNNKNNNWKHVYGPECIIETLFDDDERGGENEESINHCMKRNVPQLRFPPQVFRQANLDAFRNIIISIRKQLSLLNYDNYEKCLELYGGVGTIGLHLLDFFPSSFISSDENPYNRQCFLSTLAEMKTHDNDDYEFTASKEVTYVSKKAIDMIHHYHKNNDNAFNTADVIIMDPPRKGLEPEVLNALEDNYNNHSINAKVLVYVSCGFRAFQRDCTSLLSSGKWTLHHVEGHVLFPGSDALETLAFFIKTNNNVNNKVDTTQSSKPSQQQQYHHHQRQQGQQFLINNMTTSISRTSTMTIIPETQQRPNQHIIFD